MVNPLMKKNWDKAIISYNPTLKMFNVQLLTYDWYDIDVEKPKKGYIYSGYGKYFKNLKAAIKYAKRFAAKYEIRKKRV